MLRIATQGIRMIGFPAPYEPLKLEDDPVPQINRPKEEPTAAWEKLLRMFNLLRLS